MVMTLDEAIKHCREKVAEQSECNRACAMEHLQLLDWLIELKNFKEEEKKKLDLLNNIIEDKNTEIENQELRIEKLEEELELLKSNKF